MGLRFLFVFGLFLSSCAQVQPLGGGNKDEKAPVPDFDRSYPTFASTLVKPDEIKIPFNEFIKLNNPGVNIIVTPELITKPKYEVRGKDLFIRINKNELIDNTTYSFVFNKAISDLNEGNDTTFTYVFSTGSTIDSLRYSVVVMDVETQVPVSNAMVGLFSISDSLNPYKHRPKYLAQTNKSGLAEFQFLSEQDLSVFVYANKDGGKIAKNSMIGFITEAVHIDTLERQDTLFMFAPFVQEERGRILKKELSKQGKIEFVTNFEHDPNQITLRKELEILDFLWEVTPRKDSSILWIQATENATYTVDIPYRDSTISARIQARKVDVKKPEFKDNLINGELGISDSLTLIFDLPIKSIDTNKIFVFQSDSIRQNCDLEILNLRRLLVVPQKGQSKLWIAPAAIVFYDGSTYNDTIEIKFSRKSDKKYANLELSMEKKPNSPLILRLHKDRQVVVERLVQIDDTLIYFPLLSPGEYKLQVIVDLNGNGRFDTGDFPKKQQPEPIIWFGQTIILRANWDTQQSVEFK